MPRQLLAKCRGFEGGEMTDGQYIAVDLAGTGVGKRLKVRDMGNGRFAADAVTIVNGQEVIGQTLMVDPSAPATPKFSDDHTGEWQQFTAEGNVICFSSGNNSGVARLFGYVTIP